MAAKHCQKGNSTDVVDMTLQSYLLKCCMGKVACVICTENHAHWVRYKQSEKPVCWYPQTRRGRHARMIDAGLGSV